MSEKEAPILFYEKEYYMFSNFAAFKVNYNGRLWMTSEHAYQAAKFDDEAIIDAIFEAPSPYDAKLLAHGNENKVRKNWSEIKLTVMENILRAKLGDHSYIYEKLLSTGDREIIENSPIDAYWGTGKDGKGENHLGKLWMRLRKEMMK